MGWRLRSSRPSAHPAVNPSVLFSLSPGCWLWGPSRLPDIPQCAQPFCTALPGSDKGSRAVCSKQLGPTCDHLLHSPCNPRQHLQCWKVAAITHLATHCFSLQVPFWSTLLLATCSITSPCFDVQRLKHVRGSIKIACNYPWSGSVGARKHQYWCMMAFMFYVWVYISYPPYSTAVFDHCLCAEILESCSCLLLFLLGLDATGSSGADCNKKNPGLGGWESLVSSLLLHHRWHQWKIHAERWEVEDECS